LQKKKKEREEQKKKSKFNLHKKHKERRKRDAIPGLPFIITFQGDPAKDFRCEDVHDSINKHTYVLVPRKANYYYTLGLSRLACYMHHRITRLYEGQLLVYKAQ
jgi:hypothetical protein